MATLIPFSIIVLFAACCAFMAFVALRAFASGATAYSGAYSSETAKQFEDIFLFIPPRRLAEIAWGAAVVVAVVVFFVLGAFGGSTYLIMARLLVAFILGGGALALPSHALRFLRDRRRHRFNMQLVDALTNMGNALKSGFSIMQAIEHVVSNGESPISEEFATTMHQTRVGVSFQDAMRNMEQRVKSDDLTLVVLSIETARRTGGNLTEIFANISHTIRERLRVENRIRTLTAQGRLQGIVLGIMPIALGIVLFIIQPEMMEPFVKSIPGVITLLGVAVLLICGAFAIRKVIKIDI